MRYEEKLRREMILRGFNQQKLARFSGVSDSEVSRILSGKSQPGLENALRLARAVGVSLDYLADDKLERDPSRSAEAPWDQELLDLGQGLGMRQAVQLLMTARTLGIQRALERMYGLESRTEPVDPLGSEQDNLLESPVSPGRPGRRIVSRDEVTAG